MIQVFGTDFPGPKDQLIQANGGNMTADFMGFLRALWNRTGGGTGLANQVSTTLTATGTTQATALALVADWNFFTTVAAGSGAILPTLTGGQAVLIANSGANALSVYPPTGAQIDALGTNAAYSLAATKMQIYWFQSSSAIISTQLG